MWIGAALAAMTLALGSRKESADVRAGVFRLLVTVHTTIIGVGALIAVGTGLLITMWLAQSAGGDALAAPRIWVMQVTGLVGGLLVLLVGLPTAVKMGGLSVPMEDGTMLPEFERYRKRQAVISSVAGVLAVLSMFAGTVLE
jgi:hypothetical protein